MNNFNLVHNRLMKLKFKLIENTELESEDLTVYKNQHITVFLKQLNFTINEDNLNNLLSCIKMSSMDMNFNIYNSYLILTYENEISYEDFYNIERNNLFLRKYVVRNNYDLSRIPFLDIDNQDTKTNKQKPSDLNISIESENEIFNKIRKLNGSLTTLNDEKIQFLTNTLIEEIESN